jgi:hypothetical protein
LQDIRVAKALASDWQISGVTTLASGEPVPITFTLTSSENTSGGGDPQRVNLTCNPNSVSNRGPNDEFNTSCAVHGSRQPGKCRSNSDSRTRDQQFRRDAFPKFLPGQRETDSHIPPGNLQRFQPRPVQWE